LRFFLFNNAVIIIGFFVLTLSLTGCANKTPPQQSLGITDAEWNGYDKNKREELLKTYKQIDLANKEEDAKNQLPYVQGSVSKKNAIEVKVYDGTALMPPFTTWQAFSPATFTLNEGSCQNVLLTQLDGMAKVSLRSCYKNKFLRLDPSNYELDKQEGTASIPYSPLWEQGFAYYGINSYGYVRLKNVTVSLKIND